MTDQKTDELSEIYADLLKRQQRLGEEFERVLAENVELLYRDD